MPAVRDKSVEPEPLAEQRHVRPELREFRALLVFPAYRVLSVLPVCWALPVERSAHGQERL
jgi:hypothetical protein